jgi:pimeloyl-ACP methyl ester carboxylesterase
MRPLRAALLGGMFALAAAAGYTSEETEAKAEVYRVPPATIDPARSYLFYLHGAWIEQGGLERTHPRHGSYEYHAIARTLGQRGFVVISEARTAAVDAEDYAEKVVSQVRRLLAEGVPASHVTVMGHSKGGSIALLAASELQEEHLRYVILAGCGKRGSGFGRSFERFLEVRAARLRGRILSLYDASDRIAGSCREAFEKAALEESREVILQTGRGHGLFWTPQPVWIDEVVSWALPRDVR